MKRVGAHVSAAGGVFNAPLNAQKIGADAFALFVKNQRQWSAKPLSDSDIAQFRANLATTGIRAEHILAHDSYLINLGHPDPTLRQKSLDAFVDEVWRCEKLGIKLLNFHPGSHLNEISPQQCLQNIAECLNFAIANTSGVKLVIENTAGQGSNLGFEFAQIAYIIARVSDKTRIGVCIDTCHAFAGGYDFRTKDAYERTMSEFDRVIGYKFLSGMHLNDTKNDLGVRKDRHESLGRGFLGLASFENIMNDKNIDEIPLILETIDESIWAEEIALLRSFVR
ncbi:MULTISPECIES: deoxyribonuclease IV [unclassified Campylobacter]|uniref:deoxyribonuclease IV n=1 Tax=unclassified Campylobacter TaxID=2593542 RepID=UPI0022EA02A7|nr:MULTISPECIES: deoxyribonuclease IV [unclassified Campylobacter]MDA3043331.1 deoxyribonuclease IV [Campylobacter sp. JMF_09 ED2]MDA3044980.1 deoxyribonuclease IV [Campylobacter sp. JMF_07 ED4]MDA3064420.1 deoxyribonuclease IV [Campylobacter sp. JMF_11 EL3]MDA3071763.1 deoxyribonuclease IV [Campylobacter sp. VBCF_03 NA9]MDA3075304.1 deoxyribonuclease IV [Campylobacter sp. JMF_05 ED3]